MKLKVSEKIAGLVRIIPDIHYDYRGEYVETWNAVTYAKIRDIGFVQDDISTSRHGVLRGLHGDWTTWKLIQCLKGEIFVAVVDLKNYDYFDKNDVETFILNDKNRNQILIPPGCANGHLVLSDDCIFSYKQSTLYEGADKQFTLKWDSLNIDWPIKEPILSLRDRNGQTWEQIKQK